MGYNLLVLWYKLRYFKIYKYMKKCICGCGIEILGEYEDYKVRFETNGLSVDCGGQNDYYVAFITEHYEYGTEIEYDKCVGTQKEVTDLIKSHIVYLGS